MTDPLFLPALTPAVELRLLAEIFPECRVIRVDASLGIAALYHIGASQEERLEKWVPTAADFKRGQHRAKDLPWRIA